METKVLGIGIVALLMAVLFTAAPVSANAPPHVGDINGDGTVNLLDAVRLKMMGYGAYTGMIWDNPDINQDGEFSVADYKLLMYHVVFGDSIYPMRGYRYSYPVWRGAPHYYYYDCSFAMGGAYPGCKYTVMSGVRCRPGVYYDQIEGVFTI